MREPSPTILIVDDDPIAAAALAAIVAREFAVEVVHDGYAAVRRMLASNAPSLVLLDVRMPGWDGFEVCRRLQERRPTEAIPIIFITSDADPETEARGLELGAVDFIAKPAHPTTALARVRAHLRRQQRTSLLTDLLGRDPLTELANRRRLDATLEEACRRCVRLELPLSVAYVDVDYFKVYNDTYGHAAGDECLRRVARALATALRATDLVARYGGEEFVVLLPDTDQAGAVQVAERCRAAVEALGLPHPGSAVEDHVTISVGLATAPGACGALEPHHLLLAADRALYAAKEGGRNRVEHGQVVPPDDAQDSWAYEEESGVHPASAPRASLSQACRP